MSNSMRSVFTFRLISTLFSISLILIRGTNGQPPYEDGERFERSPSYHGSGRGHQAEFEPDPACAEVPDSGSGQQVLHVWYFSLELTQCRQLLYRGRGGSPNMFPTRRQCERRCLRHYTEGAERDGPKIKASVEHLIDRRDYRNKLLSHRSAQPSNLFRDKRGKSGKRKYNNRRNNDLDYESRGDSNGRGRRTPQRRRSNPKQKSQRRHEDSEDEF